MDKVKGNDDGIRCWLKENNCSEGDVSVQANLSDTDGASDLTQPILLETDTTQPGSTQQGKPLVEQVSAFHTSKDRVTNWNINKPEKMKTPKQL